MTAIVGILCRDGVVVGTDSSATFGALNIRTIEQKVKKLEVIGNHILVAGTGQVGLGQRFCSIVQSAYSEKQFQKPHIEVGKILSQRAIQDFGFTFAQKGEFGSIVAYTAGDRVYLCEFAVKDLQPEFKTDSMWYVSMGCGQPITDPFLGLMRRIFWKDSLPGVADAIFVVTWTLQHAIDLNTGGINGPIQMAVIRRNSEAGKYGAVILSDAEMQEHMNNVEYAEKHMAKYKDILLGNVEAQSIPK